MIDLHRYDLDPLTKQLRDKAVELGRKARAENRSRHSFMFCLTWLDHRCCTCKRWGIWFEVRLSAPGSEPIDIGPPPTCPTCAWVYAWEQTFKTIALAYLSEPFVNLISRVERVVRAGQDLDYSAKYWTDL